MKKNLNLVKIILLTILLASSLFADTTDESNDKKIEIGLKKKKSEGSGGFSFGIIQLNVDELNKRIKAFGFGEFESRFATVGGGGHGIIGEKILIGGSGFGTLPVSLENDSVRITLSGGGGFFELGYIAFESKGYRFIPVLGIGGMGTNITLKSLSNGSNNFNNLITSPSGNAEINSGGVAVKLELKNRFVFDVAENEIDSFRIGGELSFGAIYQANNDWDFEDESISNVPNTGKESYFIKLAILFGGSNKRR